MNYRDRSYNPEEPTLATLPHLTLSTGSSSNSAPSTRGTQASLMLVYPKRLGVRLMAETSVESGSERRQASFVLDSPIEEELELDVLVLSGLEQPVKSANMSKYSCPSARVPSGAGAPDCYAFISQRSVLRKIDAP